MKKTLFIFILLFCPLCVGQALPDAPMPASSKSEPGFFAFRGSWEDPPLRTNRQMFRSKTFVLSQIGAVTAMVIACRNPRSHEDWGSEAPAVAAEFGLSYLGGRFFTQSFAVAPGVYEIVHYSMAAAR